MAAEASVADLDLARLIDGRSFHPSPAAWEDKVFYFLMLDRFSDGNERGFTDNGGEVVNAGATPSYSDADRGNALGTPDAEARWQEAGTRWCGGTLKGLTSKMGYLKRLGVTALWVSPVLKQVAFQETYHGYGIQNFLDVDPHFGTRTDLREMVRVAHDNGIRVVLDIILNHSGNVFSYDADRFWTDDGSGHWFLDPRWDGAPYRPRGFNRASGEPTLPFAPLAPAADQPTADAVWPREVQQPGAFTCKVRI